MRTLGYFTICLVIGFFSCFVKAEEIKGDINAGKTKSQPCSTCHGVDGNSSQNQAWPKLAGQSMQYLGKELLDFKAGDKNGRLNPVMQSFAAPLTPQDIADLAIYYQSLPHTIGTTQPALLELGQRLYRGGDLKKGIPACAACHGPNALGNPPAAFPLLSGQHPDYIVIQLKAFRDGTRSNDYNHMMRDIAAKMDDKDIEAVASYIAGVN